MAFGQGEDKVQAMGVGFDARTGGNAYGTQTGGAGSPESMMDPLQLLDFDDPAPERVFLAHVREYQPVEKDVLFNALAKGSFGDFHRKQSSLYMIAKTRKVAFLPESFVVGSDFCLHGRVRVAQRTEQVTFNIAKLLFEQSGAGGKFADWRNWAEAVMGLWAIEGYANASASEKYRLSSKVDASLSNDANLYIDCKLFEGASGGGPERRVIVRALDLIHMFDWNLLEDIEILYVGKSTDDVLKRARNHNKWGEITTDLEDDEFAFVYFMDVAQSSVAKDRIGPFVRMADGPDEALDRDATALITEAALIKYFFDEERYNRKVVGQALADVKAIREKLVGRGYTALRVDLILDGVFGRFGTKKTGMLERHSCQYSLRAP